ncbi:hypothetical protein [Alkaliphilus sp. B6464]|uniref:hypothetical protein n=1 Tax=Alkaliphilus sp. B6464 TaxID=2731219 RepID=UPI001BAADABA|nr:hypothetical protein [Alkaliphilus sp. B6464]QUH21760.1 hypothetical protein HYG84_17645 [Alkaliphilus sp. B6464]
MERCFIATKESDFVRDYEKYRLLALEQRKFVDEFLNEKGIESNKFIVGGNGSFNVPFKENCKSDITLSIKPTQNDIENFGKVLKKPNKHHGLCGFKKGSNIAKEFAQKCVDNQIVVNLWRPRIGDYFDSLGFRGCRWESFICNDIFYLKVESDYLKKDDTPIGFIEIKQSKYYLVKEEFEKKAV